VQFKKKSSQCAVVGLSK